MANPQSKTLVLSTLFDEKIIEIIKLLLKSKENIYLRDLSRESGVSLATVYRIIQKTTEIGLTEKIKLEKYTYYRIKKDSEAYSMLFKMILGGPEDFREAVKRAMPNKTKVFFNKKDKSRVFVVGDELNKSEIQKKLARIYTEAGLTLKVLFLSEEQFHEMNSMGLLKDIE